MTSAREHEHLSYTELLDELQSLAGEGRSGIMFIRTETDHSVRIGLEKGRVVSCTYSVHKGQAAIAMIRRIRSGKYSFTQGSPGIISGVALPGNVDFFRELAAITDQDVLSAPAPVRGQGGSTGGASPPPAAPQKSSPGASDLRVSGGELFETVVRELTMSMGPIARMVAGEYEEELRSAATGEQVRAIVFRLAQEIGDARQAGELEARILDLVSR